MSFSTLEKKLKGTQTLIVRTQNKVTKWDPTKVTITEVKLVNSELTVHKDKLYELHEAIALVATADELLASDPVFDTLLEAVENLQVKVGELLNSMDDAAKPSPSFKLERIKLPQFNGDMSEWQSFHDLFVSSVDKNSTLSGAEKMVHLKSSLTGDASSIVSSFQATDANYKKAWDLVVKRYSNKREIIFAHIRKFDELKSTHDESSSGLRTVSDNLNLLVRSLTNLTVPVEHWDLILIYLALKKLPMETRKQWLLSQKTAVPTLAKFIEYIEGRARALADSETSTTKTRNKKTTAHASSSSGQGCPKCSKSHPLFKCKDFQGSSVVERREFVTKHQLCFNCLQSGHSAGKCHMELSCRKCSKRHSTLLHLEPAVQGQTSTPTAKPNNPEVEPSLDQGPVTVTHCTPLSSHSSKTGGLVLMGTFLGAVLDSKGVRQPCRVFLDPGSESNFITEFCCDRLGLKRKRTCVSVSGISGSTGETSTGLVKFELFSLVSDYKLAVSALILTKITNKLPRAKCDNNWPHLQGLELGDPTFYIPGHTDILLGAGDAATIMIPGIRKGPTGTPTAQNTRYGWILSGAVNYAPSFHMQVNTHHSRCSSTNPCLDTTLKRFWELEEPEVEEKTLGEEDGACESHFQNTHVRESNGSYIVELPFKSNAPALGHSRESALKRFLKVERRLSLQPEVKVEYTKCMRESLAANFMELIPTEELNKPNEGCYYLPHREVIKDSSTTTKVRIVMDASAKSSNGLSLNDVLMTGPKLQPDLVPLMIKFRCYAVAMSADIVKFYPQFKINKKHVDYQRLLWRESPSYPVEDYRMLRVTFGVTSAPYLAVRCLNQLAEDESGSFPQAASVIKNSFLVDNLLSGATDVPKALALQQELLSVMKRGNLQLRKWSSNCNDLVQAVPPEQRECEFPLAIKEDEAIKTIGVLWNPVMDLFGISVIIPDMSTPSTKRSVLSAIARTFDPLGWLSPVTIRPKILMQEMWRLKLEWDSELQSQLAKEWIDYCGDLAKLQSFRLKRCLVAPGGQEVKYELHGFSDASVAAYAACVYMRTVSSTGIYTNLVIAKTKVCPLKPETIPRLELCGAVLLAKLMNTVRNSVTQSISVIRAWTDSTIVLDWLKSKNKLPVFINNRVNIIKNLIHSDLWFHVNGDENPADPASRGISAEKLLNSELWLSGPLWLISSVFPPLEPEASYSATIEESPFGVIVNKCSSYTKMIRTVAYAQRFINNCRKAPKLLGPLSTAELAKAHKIIVAIVQGEAFGKEIQLCQTKLQVKSPLKFLSPFLDSEGLLRVGGRLKYSSLNSDKQHPLLLPRDHNFTEAMVRYYHLLNLHAGPQFLLSLTRERYWIQRGSDVVKRIVKKCVVCHKQNPATTHQLMGQLPSSRVIPSKPFSKTGMDYAGPFNLCVVPGRKPKLIKCYVAVFICMATKAIHLELVGDLTTESFIGALTRLIARRGLPSDLFCDGGKNFVGAANEMKQFMKFIRSPSHQTNLHDFLAMKEIRYHFNPPLAPHQGGLWEAGVKSMKYHLKRVVGDRHLSIEEFNTLLCQVEACLNSRPLTQLSSNPDDFGVLTPGHFLMGEAPLAHPQHDITDINSNRLTRWQLVQQLYQHLWRRWSREYLQTLQSRPKWYWPQPNLEVGVLVLIQDDQPCWGPLKWKLGRIAAVYPGQDGKVRVCDVRTAAGPVYKRPVVKLSPLPIYD